MTTLPVRLSQVDPQVCDTVTQSEDATRAGETLVGNGTWLTVHEVAQRLVVSDGTARSYADAGKVVHEGVTYPLTTRRMPGKLRHRRVLASDVDAAQVGMFGHAPPTDDPPSS